MAISQSIESKAIENAVNHTTTHTGLNQLLDLETHVFHTQHKQLSSIDNNVATLNESIRLLLFQNKETITKRIRKTRKVKREMISESSLYKRYQLPFGYLNIQLTQSQHNTRKNEQNFSASSHTLSWIFVAPHWLDSLGFKAQVAVDFSNRACSGFKTSLIPFTVNERPELLKAVRSADVIGLRKLFESNLARPTDYIVEEFDSRDKELQSVIEVGFT